MEPNGSEPAVMRAVQQAMGPTHSPYPVPNSSARTDPTSALAPARVAGGTVGRIMVSVVKHGDRLGFGVRHDQAQRVVISTPGHHSALCEGDILVSVNGAPLGGPDFAAIVEQLKAIPPGRLEFEIERPVPARKQPVARIERVSAPLQAHGVYAPAPAVGGPSIVPAVLTASASNAPPPALGIALAPTPPLSGQPPLKKPRVAANGSAATMSSSTLTSNSIVYNGSVPNVLPPGAPAVATPVEKKPTVNALMKEIERQRAEKQTLENKSAALRKRLQQMLIDCDEVRVRASAEVQAAEEKAQREVEEAQQALAAARAQLRIADRAPDVGRADSIAFDLEAARAQLDKLRKAEAERTAMLNSRYTMENRLAEREVHRLLDALTEDACAQLRVIARRHTANKSSASGSGVGGGATDDANTVSVTREGVRRLAFLKLVGLPHDVSLYLSPSYQSLEVLRHEIGRDRLVDLFGTALRHEERAGLFYVASAPMDVTFDPRTETLVLKCGWTEQNAIRDLARNLRF